MTGTVFAAYLAGVATGIVASALSLIVGAVWLVRRF